MDLLFPDKRKAITGEFYMADSRIRHSSRKAFKRISSWKASLSASDEAELHYHDQYRNLIRNTFFNTVTNIYILSKEKYYERPLMN